MRRKFRRAGKARSWRRHAGRLGRRSVRRKPGNSVIGRFALSLVMLVTLAGMQRAACAADSTGVQERPNLLLIITDQQSADVMSCRMGRQHIHTPAIDRLAAEGVLFTRAYSANPLCMPLRNSLFTGRYPHQTGVTHNGRPPGGMDPQRLVMMGVYFRRAGYETAYTGKWHLCYPKNDPGTHGFEILQGPKLPAEQGGQDAAAAAAAVEFLRRKHQRPFLLVVSLLNPHNVCEWSRRLAGMEQRLSCGEIGQPPALDQLPPPPANLAPPRHEPDGMTLLRRAYHANSLFPVGNFTVEDWRKLRWGYYRMVEKVDAEIAKVLEALKSTAAEEDTLIVFTSDHGDCAGAHGFNQKTVFYDESSRIPLIITWKGHTPQATCEKLVNIGVDILPTLLDAAGLEIPRELPGHSLLPLALGEPIEQWRDFVVVENDMVQTGKVDGFKPTMQGRMVRSQGYKYCVYEYGRRREALYDMENDPGETVNLAYDPKYREVVLAHRRMLERFGREQNDPLVAQLLADEVAPRPFDRSPAGQPSAGRGH